MTRSRRSHEIMRLVVEEGLTCQEVAEQFGITKMRVSAIVKQFYPEGVRAARQNRHRPEVKKEA